MTPSDRLAYRSYSPVLSIIVTLLFVAAPGVLRAQCPLPAHCCPECTTSDADATYAFLCPSNASDSLTVHVLLRDAFGTAFNVPWPQCALSLLCSDGSGTGVEPVADTDVSGEGTFRAVVADVLPSTGCCPSMIVRLDFGEGVTCDIPVQQFSPPTDAPTLPGESGVFRLLAAPNPSAGSLRVIYEIPRASRLTLDVLDAAGRVVRRLEDGERGSGSRSSTWDGRDERGSALASGIYFVRLRAAGQSQVAKVVIAR